MGSSILERAREGPRLRRAEDGARSQDRSVRRRRGDAALHRATPRRLPARELSRRDLARFAARLAASRANAISRAAARSPREAHQRKRDRSRSSIRPAAPGISSCARSICSSPCTKKRASAIPRGSPRRSSPRACSGSISTPTRRDRRGRARASRCRARADALGAARLARRVQSIARGRERLRIAAHLESRSRRRRARRRARDHVRSARPSRHARRALCLAKTIRGPRSRALRRRALDRFAASHPRAARLVAMSARSLRRRRDEPALRRVPQALARDPRARRRRSAGDASISSSPFFPRFLAPRAGRRARRDHAFELDDEQPHRAFATRDARSGRAERRRRPRATRLRHGAAPLRFAPSDPQGDRRSKRSRARRELRHLARTGGVRRRGARARGARRRQALPLCDRLRLAESAFLADRAGRAPRNRAEAGRRSEISSARSTASGPERTIATCAKGGRSPRQTPLGSRRREVRATLAGTLRPFVACAPRSREPGPESTARDRAIPAIEYARVAGGKLAARIARRGTAAIAGVVTLVPLAGVDRARVFEALAIFNARVGTAWLATLTSGLNFNPGYAAQIPLGREAPDPSFEAEVRAIARVEARRERRGSGVRRFRSHASSTAEPAGCWIAPSAGAKKGLERALAILEAEGRIEARLKDHLELSDAAWAEIDAELGEPAAALPRAIPPIALRDRPARATKRTTRPHPFGRARAISKRSRAKHRVHPRTLLEGPFRLISPKRCAPPKTRGAADTRRIW